MPEDLTDRQLETFDQMLTDMPEKWTFEDVLPDGAEDELVHALVMFVDQGYARRIGTRGERAVYTLTPEGEDVINE